jgi:hypothetical protein
MAKSPEQKLEEAQKQKEYEASLLPLGPVAGSNPPITVCLAPNTGEKEGYPTHYQVVGQVDFPGGKGVGPSSVFAKNGAVRTGVLTYGQSALFGTIVNPDGSVYPTINGNKQTYASGSDPNESA